MMKRPQAKGAGLASLMLCLALLLLISPGFAAQNTLSWTAQFGAASGTDEIATGVSTEDGLFVVGTTTGALPGQSSAGGVDGWIRKYDRYGHVEWTEQFGTAGDDVPYGIGGNNVVGLYIVGTTTGAFSGETNAGGVDIFARKYNTDGSYLWTDQTGTAGTDELTDIDVYDTNGVRVAGRTDGDLAAESEGGFDALAGSLGPDGGFVLYQWGTASDDAATAVAFSNQNVSYVSGYTDGTLPDQTSAGGRDAFVVSFGPNQLPVWMTQFGTASDDEADGAAFNDAYVLVGGKTAGTLPGETSAGGTDAFIAAFDLAGSQVWTTQFGTSGYDAVHDVAGTATLPVAYAVGETEGTFAGEAAAGGGDIFAARFDVSGSRVWTDQIGSSGADAVFAAELDASLQHLYPVGYATGALPGASSSGAKDAFVLRYVQDNDDDGIFNEVDVLPYDHTDIFLDETTETDTDGQVLDRGDVNLNIYDAADPADGVVAVAVAAGGSQPADVQFCRGLADSQLDLGDAVEVTCGSAKIGVLGGVVDTTFISPDGLNSTTSYDAGNELKYDPADGTFVASDGNPDSIVVNIGATDQIVGPGQTLKLVTLAADSFLREGHEDQNEGANPGLILRKQGSTRPMAQFDLSGVSLTGLVKATLVLTISSTPPAQWGNAGRPIEVRRLTQPWTEGNGRDIDMPEADSTRGNGAGVTWRCATDTDIANTAKDCEGNWNGGAFAARTAPTVTVVNGMTGEVAFDVTQDVLAGAGNGWLVKKVNESQNGNIRFYSKEGASGDASLAPKLILQYE